MGICQGKKLYVVNVHIFQNVLWMNVIFSDIIVKIAGQKLSAHKFIMAARSDFWSNRDLNELSELELTGMGIA